MATFTVARPMRRPSLSGLMDEMLREMSSGRLPFDSRWPETRGVYPAINLSETNEGYVLTAELPGVAPEDVDVTIEGSTVTLSGERKVEQTAGDGTAVHRRERQSGTFRRAFELPSEIDLDKAKARHKHGVLTLSLPKSDAMKPRQITVETN